MHSTLHAEARLTQRLVQDSCRLCCRRCNPPRRSFHRTRDLRSTQGARNDAGSNPSASTPEKKEDIDDRPTIASNATPPGFALPASIAQHFFHQGGPPPEDGDQPSTSSFYGSPANRKMRSRGLKELPEPTAVAPEWFRDHNVILWGEGEQPSMQDVYPSQATAAREGDTQQDSAPAESPHDAADPSPPEDEAGSSQEVQAQSRAMGFGPPSESQTLTKRLPHDCKYFIDTAQDQEIMHMVRGLINAPEKREDHDEPAVQTAHLVLHYANKNGELLLEEYVRSLAARLECDLITLDVQDIADLICKARQGVGITNAGRMLSYEVLSMIDQKSEKITDEDMADALDAEGSAEDFEEDDDHTPMSNPSARNPMGLPMLLGKPITIDLGNIFGSQRNQRTPGKANGPLTPSNFFSDMFQSRGQKQQDDSSPFTATIESLLSVLQSKRVQRAQEASEKPGTGIDPKKRLFGKDCAILHISDVKAIQTASVKIGNRFLIELYRQIDKRRSDGENIILIGSESSKLDSYIPPRDSISTIQRAKDEEISRDIVITPVVPDRIFEKDFHVDNVKHSAHDSRGLFNKHVASELRTDRERRIVALNMRHIWEMMRLKSKHDFLGLKPGFWKDDVYSKLTEDDQKTLNHEVWSFSHVHRICSYISGLSKPLPSVPSPLFPKSWPEDKIVPLISGVSTLLGDSDRTKVKWADAEQERDQKKNRLEMPSKANSRFAEIRASATKHEKRLMSGIIEADKISTTFADVHMPAETVDALQTLTMLSLVRPEAFSYGVLASDKIPGLLLYGPPGTGKTLAAKAVAKESGATMLEVSAAEINDMFVGEGEKNVKALFSLAKKLSPCVVFLDEADAMFSARSNSGRRVSHRELLNQFLKEWDGMSNDSGSAFIMVATNRPMDLDDAVLRRLPRRLLIDLPAESDRTEILKIHVRSEQLAEDVDLTDLAKKTPFYSGSDLKNLAVTAALNAVREETETFHKSEKTIKDYKFPEKRTLTKAHFEKALEDISASISEDMSSLRDIKKFDEQYGDKRGKRKRGPKWGFKSAGEADRVLDTVKVRS